MKKIKLMMLMIGVLSSVLAADNLKLSMKLWNRFTFEHHGEETKKAYWSLSRGYLRIEPKFSDRIKGRFNIDLFSDDDAEDGAGLKLKYAYLDFKEIIHIKNSKITIGLMKNYFGLIYDWDYTTIQKAFEDKEKLVSSTDYGLGFIGKLPNKFGEYAICAYNGEGYKKTDGKVNTNPAGLANLRVIPFKGFTIGGSALYEMSGILDSTQNKYDKRVVVAGIGKINYGSISILGEYIMAQKGDPNEPKKSAGFMIMPTVKIVRRLQLVSRFDDYDKDKDSDDDKHQRFLAGFNWFLKFDSKDKPKIWLQLQGERTKYEDSEKDPKDYIWLQLRWKFSSKLK